MPDQGTFAEYICCPATDVYSKPAHLSWEQSAAVPLAGLTAWRAVVTQAEVKAGQTVLVTGAGSGVSTFAIQWASALGAEVYVTSGSEEKIDKAKSIGATGGVSYRQEDYHKILKKQAGGFNAIIDSAGGDDMNNLLEYLEARRAVRIFRRHTRRPLDRSGNTKAVFQPDTHTGDDDGLQCRIQGDAGICQREQN